MNIVILTIGTLGDVQPYVALASGLKEAGYDVALATHQCFRAFVTSRGIQFSPVTGDPSTWAEGIELQHLADSGKSFRQWMFTLRQLAQPLITDILNSCWLASQGADAIIYSPLAWVGYSIAEKLKVPSFLACLQPMTPTRHFPSVWIHSGFKMNGNFNHLTHVIAEQFYWHLNKPFINRWRSDTLGLPPLPAAGPYKEKRWVQQPYLYGFSSHVIHRPADWPERVHMTGFWFLPDTLSCRPDLRIATFLEQGPPPIYIGFGSMPESQPEKFRATILEALALSGQRAIIQGKWSLGSSLPESILSIDRVPHGWLFPKCRAIVHHGGASTLANSLRAGVPTVVIPFAWDQFFWGERVFNLGVGPKPVGRKKMNSRNLSRAINAAVPE
jgi:UDP:flavonoid glycosyltransferase YjiC (YdhE family)